VVQEERVIALFSGLAFGVSAAAVRAFLALSRRRFLDQPGARSSHAVATPTGGGFPAVLAFLLVSSLAVAIHALPGGTRYWASVGCAGVLSLLGLLDDALDLPSAARFLVHALVALAVVHWVGRPGPPGGALALVVTALCVVVVVGLINAFNFMDGIDALVGGTGVAIASFLAVLSRDPFWFLLAASYAGFLIFNLPPARIFMGDAGSTVLGGLFGVLLLSGRAQLELRHLLLFGPLLGDSAYTIVRRLLRGENVLQAHHSHLYQRLFRAGHSHAAISASYVAATLVMGVLVTFGGNVVAFAGAAACVLAIVAIERHLSRRAVPFTRPRPESSSA
jgi:UDP-N-acetylmuramyl pentapeptide phosphotransferase/UDP-N-acetylglucosamine-1-phosphate transferase